MNKTPGAEETLRQRAERIVAEKKQLHPDKMTPEEIQATLHELHVHQIELEMQNEELRHAQTEIENARARYFDLYDIAPVGYCTLSEKGIILEANITAANLFGTTRSELIGKPFSKYIQKKDQDIYYLHKLRLFEEEKPQSCELRMNRGGEGFFWAHINALVARSQDSQSVCRITITDTSEQKKTEEAFRESERKAVALVNDLEEADENKNKFISVLSHELRNPLAAISAGIQVLNITKDINQTIRVKEIINRQTIQLCKLVDDLLELTRITQNKIKLKKEDINLNEIVKSALEDIRLEYEKKGVKLGTKIQTKPILLCADPVRITQALGNILFNALKFTKANGTVWLILKTEKDYAVIRVKDNGIGISPEILSHLFTPFTQADKSLDRSGSGLGLGLSIVKGIVDLHEGSVEAYSDGLGKGSDFTIRLPIKSGEDLLMEKITPDIRDKKTLKLLVIEDNKDFADLLSTMLSTIGYNISVAYDGIDGLKQAKQIKPDVIFCDIGLPGISGYDVAERIRNDEELKNTHLIALTGYAGEGDAELAIRAGFNKHLAKPVDMETLKNVL